MKRTIIPIVLGIILFGALEAGAQSVPSKPAYRGPVYEAIPAKTVVMELLNEDEVNSGAKVRACKDFTYPASLAMDKKFRPDSLSGSKLSWTPQMDDTSKKEYEIPYYIVSKNGTTRLETVRVRVISFPTRTGYHFISDEKGRLDFAIEVNHWTENVEIDIIDEHGRVVEQLKDVYKGKLDLPEGHYTAKTRITSSFPILTNFRDTFSIRIPEKEINPTETPLSTLVISPPLSSLITPANTPTIESGTRQQEAGQLLQTELSVYPNPSQGKINVASNKSIRQLAILSLSGSLIIQSQPMVNEYHGDLNGLPPGYYFIRIELEDGSVETVKFVLTETSN